MKIINYFFNSYFFYVVFPLPLALLVLVLAMALQFLYQAIAGHAWKLPYLAGFGLLIVSNLLFLSASRVDLDTDMQESGSFTAPASGHTMSSFIPCAGSLDQYLQPLHQSYTAFTILLVTHTCILNACTQNMARLYASRQINSVSSVSKLGRTFICIDKMRMARL